MSLSRLKLAKWSFELDVSDGLRAVSLDNGITGDSLALGLHSELEVYLDASYKRIWIEGWRVSQLQQDTAEPDQETGYLAGYYKPWFDDASWDTDSTPKMGLPERGWAWARTHAFIPEDCKNKDVTLFLGGRGFRCKHMRVFINGQEVGMQFATDWDNEPAKIILLNGSKEHSRLRFGQDNIIALQLYETTYCTAFEQCLVVGEPYNNPRSEVVSVKQSREDRLQAKLIAVDKTLSAVITYRPAQNGAIIIKSTKLTNKSKKSVRVMNLRLGTYQTEGNANGGGLGFPAYVNDQIFITLAHPAGWAIAENGNIKLRQYPGVLLAPGQSFQCMDAVYGVSERGQARQLFINYLKKNMRRTVRRHDKPYAIFEFFAGWPGSDGIYGMNEKYCLDLVDAIEDFKKQTNENFDIACMEFWHDTAGDLTLFNRKGFPNGFDKVRDRFTELEIKPGLWITGSGGAWNIGDNPVVFSCTLDNPPYFTPKEPYSPMLCRAADPFRSIFANGFLYQARENGVRLFKFDDLRRVCYNVNHPEHLPGLSSIEAIFNAMIETFHALDEVSPDVFLVLYWGYSSPWWLLHADTIFESGWGAEAASPSETPSLYARDGVIVSMDQSKANAESKHDIPALAHDSLGIWLSDWGWNSSIGKERWQEGMVMDLCRGSLLLQPWTDRTWLTPPERAQFGELLNLLRNRPRCFANSKRILGDPMKIEPYGYACTDGQRGFVALHNCSWQDLEVELYLGPSWGLNDRKRYHLYRRYPDPAQLVGESEIFQGSATVWMRPFETALFELVPTGEKPTGVRVFEGKAIIAFKECSMDILVTVAEASPDAAPEPVLILEQKAAGQTPSPMQSIVVTGTTPATEAGGILHISACGKQNIANAISIADTGKYISANGYLGDSEVALEPVLGRYTYPTRWQAWRIRIPAYSQALPFRLNINAALENELEVAAHFIPADNYSLK